MSKDLKRKSDQIESNEFSLKKQMLTDSNDESLPSNINFINKIKNIINTNFDQEISYKQFELEKIDERIYEAQNMLDKLRVCIICNYYSSNGRLNLNEYINHPSICKLKCEHLDAAINHKMDQSENSDIIKDNSNLIKEDIKIENDLNDDKKRVNISKEDSSQIEISSFTKQFNVKICVGNVSKYLNNDKAGTTSNQKLNQTLAMNEDESIKTTVESSQYNKDLITHKWMIYIRSPNCSKLDNYIKKVVFYLHFSYKPYDVIEVRSPPFQLIRKGWGEFPIRIQIHFKDPRNKRVDINHLLKLDWTQTGLQTFGGETSKDIDLVMKPNDFKVDVTKIELNKVRNQYNIENSTKQQPQATELVQQTIKNENKKEYQNFNINNIPEIASPISNSPSSNLSFKNLNNQSDFDLSPSNFLSTGMNSLATNFNNFNFPKNSSYDEFILNFCTNELNNANSNDTTYSKDKTNECNATKSSDAAIMPVQPNSKQSASASIDELLNLRPKSIASTLQINSSALKPSTLSKLPIQVVKTIKSATSLVSLTNKPTFNTQDHVITPTNFKSPSSDSINLEENVQSDKNPTAQVNTVVNQTMTSSILIPSKLDQLKKLPQAKPIIPFQKNLDFLSTKSSNMLTNKKIVIYKVEPDDIKDLNEKSTTSIFNLALSNSSNGNLSNPNTCTNKSEGKLDSSLTTTQIKTTLNTQNKPIQLTKIKPKPNENEPIYVEQNQKQPTANEISCLNNKDIQFRLVEDSYNQLVDKSDVLKLQEKHGLESKAKTIENNKLNQKETMSTDSSKQNESLIYSVHTLIENLEKTKTLNDNLTFESYLKIALKYYPIILNTPADCSMVDLQKLKQTYPFAASSIHEFYSWPYAKRKSSEWMRALYIKRKCVHLINSAKFFNNLHIDIWSTKNVLLWLRSHGYTPLEYRHMEMRSVKRTYKMNIDESSEFDYVDSLTPFNKFISYEKYLKFLTKSTCLNDVNEEMHEDDDDENVLIDIINEIDDKKSKKLVCGFKKTNLILDNLGNTKNKIEMCDGSKYVKEQLDLLNIKTSPVELVAMDEKQNETNTYSCHVVEKFLFALCKRFSEDIIRQTCADTYFDRSKLLIQNKVTDNSMKKANKTETTKKNETQLATSSQSVLQSDYLQHQKFPECLGVCDIYKTIIKHDRYDFLTNKGMASEIDRENKEKTISSEIVNLVNSNSDNN